jgi:hypothetical protein
MSVQINKNCKELPYTFYSKTILWILFQNGQWDSQISVCNFKITDENTSYIQLFYAILQDLKLVFKCLRLENDYVMIFKNWFVPYWWVKATCVIKVRNTGGDISTSWIPDFFFVNSQFKHSEFSNSRFQLHEFTISTSEIQLYEFKVFRSLFQLGKFYNFSFVFSQFQLHELNIATTRIQDFNITITVSLIHVFMFHVFHNFNCTNSRLNLHEVEILNSWS